MVDISMIIEKNRLFLEGNFGRVPEIDDSLWFIMSRKYGTKITFMTGKLQTYSLSPQGHISIQIHNPEYGSFWISSEPAIEETVFLSYNAMIEAIAVYAHKLKIDEIILAPFMVGTEICMGAEEIKSSFEKVLSHNPERILRCY